MLFSYILASNPDVYSYKLDLSHLPCILSFSRVLVHVWAQHVLCVTLNSFQYPISLSCLCAARSQNVFVSLYFSS